MSKPTMTFVKFVLLVVVIATFLAACTPAPAPTPVPAAPPTAVPATKGAVAPTQAAVAPTQAQPPATAVPTKAAAADKPTDIELWFGLSVTESAPPPEDWVALKLIREKLNINLKLVALPSSQGDQDTKINAAAAANNLPDVFMVNRDPVLFKLVQNGLVAPVDKLLPLMPERTKTHYNDADRNKLATWDGVLYGLPDPGTLPHIDGLVVRRDWLDKLGLKAPTTLDEFLAVAKAFTEKDPDGNGRNDTYGYCAYIEGTGLLRAGLGTRFDWIFGAYGAAGVWNLDPSSFGLNVRNSNYMKGLQFIKKMVDAKVIDPDWPTLKKEEFRARWKQGRCGMMHENFAALSTISNYSDFDKSFPNALWEVLPPPKGPEGKSAMGVEVKDARIYAISKKAMDAGKGPAIAKLFEWMATDGYMLLAFGQEGVNYKLDKDGFVTTEGLDPNQAWTSKAAQPLTQMRNMVYVNNAIELKARYPAFKTVSGRIQDPLAYRGAFDKQPYQESTGASIINPPSNAADFVRFYSENQVKFVLGQQPLDDKTWGDYISGLDKLGAKDLEANAKKTLIQTGFMK